MVDFTLPELLFESPYLTKQIIAYIGNKRRLLELIYKAIVQTGLEIKPGLKFFDAFSGSGAVSRLAKSLNFEVFCNDWEEYAFVLSEAFVKMNAKDAETLFGGKEKLSSLIEKINSLENPSEENQYIAKYYAPKSFEIDKADFKTERLFYTRENALSIDKIRNYIEKNLTDEKKSLLTAVLIYEAATHTNTSGVFKSFHKGFGGHNKDALSRILAKIKLREPVLIDSDYPVHVYKENANNLVSLKELQNIDIAYLDPPYNQHQYGSNYHLLNTIAKWDKIPEPLDLNKKGSLKEKAAIRPDWRNTRSAYCYKDSAIEAFQDLINNLSAHFILVSYSTDGIIPFETMQKICAEKGELSIITNEYTKYRGGQQSNLRKNRNIEFVLIVDTTKKSSKESLQKIEAVLARKKFLLLFKQRFCESKLKKFAIPCHSTDKKFEKFSIKLSSGKNVDFLTKAYLEVFAPENADSLTFDELEEIYSLLENCVCQTKQAEIDEILSKIKDSSITLSKKNKMLVRLIPATLKKLASKKSKDLFYSSLKKVKSLEVEKRDLYLLIKEKIEQIELIANARFFS